jgi:hypothetical protein
VKFIVAILLFISFKLGAQPYVANWTGAGHSLYLVQQGKDSLNWTTIGTVAGQLNSSTYQFTIPGPSYYYRIKADQDSTCAILVAEVVSIKNPSPAHGKKSTIQTLSVKVSVSNRIHYTIESQRDQLMTYSLYDMTGRKLSSKLVPLHIGVNDFFDRKPDVFGVYYGTFEGYFDFVSVKIMNYVSGY